MRRFFTSDGVHVTRVSTSRRNGRRFIHLRLAVSDVRQSAERAPFSWATLRAARRGEQYVYTQP